MRQGIFLLESLFSADSLLVSVHPPPLLQGTAVRGIAVRGTEVQGIAGRSVAVRGTVGLGHSEPTRKTTSPGTFMTTRRILLQ